MNFLIKLLTTNYNLSWSRTEIVHGWMLTFSFNWCPSENYKQGILTVDFFKWGFQCSVGWFW